MNRTLTLTCLGVAGLPMLLAFAGCTGKTTAPVATFAGSVQLYDVYGNPLADNSGVTVSVYDNAATSTTTAADGSFTLANVDMSTPPRLKMAKATFGTYYTEQLTTTAATYTLPKRVRIGQYSTAYYQVTYVPNGVGRYLVINGTRLPAGTDTKQLMHRVYFNPSQDDIGPLIYTSKFSKGFRNNLATGFSDTIRYDMLKAAGLYKNMGFVVATDNLVADSCAAPFQRYDRTGTPYGPIIFWKSYPAGGVSSDFISSTVLPNY